ncbi:NUDIX domain-containing protein [Sulfurovum sp. XGS-02]|uniref:NUDIX domain-containing protein n=1 Tax=Sulfurovum sp. XGS-02 TaxID=2925411 RepID=UPI00206E2FF2|nr:NUDIX domain-containing protein [Sulfurovum sp. XGS-02]UPT78645.1 NUDIX domain-containing protein [Sulfurovum sp. XGS-02]
MENKIKHFKLQPLVNAKFISTAFATYEQEGIPKSWEIVEAHDSVSILLYHKEKRSFILVKQFRPAVYLNNKKGMTVELCAGIVDKELSLAEIVKEEVEEECGYDIPLSNIEKITSFHTSVGFAGSKQTLYFAEVEEHMKVSEGGGVDHEQIEVVYLPTDEAKKFLYDESIAKTPGLMFAFMWWFERN